MPRHKSNAPPLSRNIHVAKVYKGYPTVLRNRLLELRELVFTSAANHENIGVLTETLRWGVPSYLTEASRSGTTIRLGVESKTSDRLGLYVPCQTTLIADFKSFYGKLFTYSGKRALLFDPQQPLPTEQLSHCITLALTYHRQKRRARIS